MTTSDTSQSQCLSPYTNADTSTRPIMRVTAMGHTAMYSPHHRPCQSLTQRRLLGGIISNAIYRQRGLVPCLRSHSWYFSEQRFKPRAFPSYHRPTILSMDPTNSSQVKTVTFIEHLLNSRNTELNSWPGVLWTLKTHLLMNSLHICELI